MKQKVSLIILIILLTFTTSFALIDENKILDDVTESINEHPEHWIDTGHLFIYCNDKSKMKYLKSLAWPEHESNLILIYSFYTTFNYVQLQKPFEHKFKGEKLKELMKAIKLYKLKKLMNEVGGVLNKKSEPKIEEVKPQKEATTGKKSKKL